MSPDPRAGAHGSDGVHGTLGEEISKLVELLQGALSSGMAGATVGGSQECRVCPVCQLLAVLRETRPETFGHLLDAAGSAAAALRSAVESSEREWTAGRRAPSERIDIG